MNSPAKAQAIMRDLGATLAKRLAPSATINTVRSANDANGWPMLFLSTGGNEAEGQPVVALRIKGIDMGSKDVFGNALTAYAPHTMEFAYELTATTNKAFPTLTDLMTIQYEATKPGTQFLIEQIANGTAVTETSMNAATPTAQLDDLYWPSKGV